MNQWATEGDASQCGWEVNDVVLSKALSSS